MIPSPLVAALTEVSRTLRGLSGLARALAGLAAAAILLAVVAWAIRAGWLLAPHWIVVAWLAVTAMVVASFAWARRTIAAVGPRSVSNLLETSGAWRHGALGTLLESPSPGTSASLHSAAVSMRASEVMRQAPQLLAPAIHDAQRASRASVSVLAIALVGVIAARPAQGAVAALWHPWRAARAVVAPVQLHARRTTVARGERAMLDVEVIGHRSAVLFTRAPGEVWQTRQIALDDLGRATIVTDPLTAELVVRVAAGGRHSADVHVAVRVPAFLGAFTATAHYPAYLALQDEPLSTAGDTIAVPEGTRIALAGQATAALRGAAMVEQGDSVALAVNGTGFRGEWLPRRNGSWRLDVATESGAPLNGALPVIPVRVIVDSAPIVEMPVPGADTIAAPSLRLAVVVSARDDHGITAIAVEMRRGALGTPTRVSLPLASGLSDRALVGASLDLAMLGTHPGDTVHYTAVAADNAPARHIGRSREFVVRIPTDAEQRAARAQQTVAALAAFDSVSRQAASAQRNEEDLARERQRQDAKSTAANARNENGDKDPLASESARKAQAAAQAQQKVMDDASKLKQAVQQLQDAAQREQSPDTSLARQLSEINKLLDKALSPELREKLAALQQAVKDLDADRTQTSMQDLARQQAQLKEAMEQARELFKRAALESDLANMSQEAAQLATEQRDVNAKMAQRDSAAATREAALAQRTDSLAAALQRAASQAPAPSAADGMKRSAQQAQQAAESMKGAAQAGKQGKQADAQQQGKQAEDQLNPLSKAIDQQSKSMQAEMRADVSRLLGRALAETARLASRQLGIAQAMQQSGTISDIRADESLVEEGAAKLMQQLATVSAMNALVSPQAGVSLAQARELMRDAITAISTATPNTRDATEKAGDATDALAVAAYALLQSKDKVDGSQSGSGVQEAMQQMQQMAGQQGQLAQQGAGMMQPGGTSAQQLMQMAMAQRGLAQRLDRMRAGGQLPGAGQMAREAKELSQTMESGRLNQDVVERQQKLFKRMLDAGRTLQGQEDDDKKERQSTVAKDGAAAIPAPVDPRILRGTGDVRLPPWDVLQKLAPEDRRRVVEYFQRLTQGTP